MNNDPYIDGLCSIMSQGIVDYLEEERIKGTVTVYKLNPLTNKYEPYEEPIIRDYDYLIQSFSKYAGISRDRFYDKDNKRRNSQMAS